jgi:DNA repair protein RadD
MSLTLRPYQQESINSIYRYFEKQTGNPLIVIPTAGGKSLVMAKFIEGVLKAHPDQHILIVTHVRELIQQNFDELKGIWPDAPAGIYSAGLKQRNLEAKILFAGIQSIYKKVSEMRAYDLVLIDEAHLIPRASNTRYCSFLKELKQRNPLIKVIGLTATPYRLDSGLLHEGDGAIFSDIAHEAGISELIDAGYLVRLISKRTKTQLDVTGVGTRGGEFIAGELEAAVDRQHITEPAVDEIVTLGVSRKSWIVFCVGVGHAYHVRDAIRAKGITCETIVGATPSEERKRLISNFKAGKIRCLTNANVLTTGFNAPQVDLIAMLRPTKSTGLYVQIVGRGCRLAPGKTDCLVLDFAGNIARHGPIDAVDPKKERKKDGEKGAPTKVCPNCDSILHAAQSECPDCGYIFQSTGPTLFPTASTLDILRPREPQWVDVTEVRYSRHNKAGSPPSLRVDYFAGLVHHSEWICIEHGGYARTKAEKWWRKRGWGLPLPAKVDDALRFAKQLRQPHQIAVRPEGKYTKIIDTRF